MDKNIIQIAISNPKRTKIQFAHSSTDNNSFNNTGPQNLSSHQNYYYWEACFTEHIQLPHTFWSSVTAT